MRKEEREENFTTKDTQKSDENEAPWERGRPRPHSLRQLLMLVGGRRYHPGRDFYGPMDIEDGWLFLTTKNAENTKEEN